MAVAALSSSCQSLERQFLLFPWCVMLLVPFVDFRIDSDVGKPPEMAENIRDASAFVTLFLKVRSSKLSTSNGFGIDSEHAMSS